MDPWIVHSCRLLIVFVGVLRLRSAADSSLEVSKRRRWPRRFVLFSVFIFYKKAQPIRFSPIYTTRN